MNIAQAKEQIENAMKAYFTKDEFGQYRIPIEKQRPVLLIGPPGIGKTAIMEQIASELGVGLVSYSMTHHTRQSALGLPFITEGEFEGYEYRVSEYTMSEIIGSIYKMMKQTGIREGILFLDEINCVSETLAPCMLQFLQYKVFGQHQIPEGWIVVTAGNPPEYNKSVRDFDIVTWDRLKRIDVTPDYDVWKKYALNKGVHPSVLTYLEARKKDFYGIESTVDGRHFVTARGWDDLSEMIRLYEENDITVDELLISQYIQNPKIAKDFAIYYDLFKKYKSDYRIDEILGGNASEDILFRAKNAPLDERISFLGILFDAITAKLKDVCLMEDTLDLLTPYLKALREKLGENISEVSDPSAEKIYMPDIIREKTECIYEEIEKGRKASSMSGNKITALRKCGAILEGYRKDVMTSGTASSTDCFEVIKKSFVDTVDELKQLSKVGVDSLNNAFEFCEKAFEDGDEILIFVTELTVNYYTARFIGHYGCDKYFMHNKELQFAERQADLVKKAGKLSFEI